MAKPILLVEDSPNDIELALMALAKAGIKQEIIVVRDGEEALDYLLCRGAYADRPAGNPGVVLLDLKLPKVDGVEVLKTIRFAPQLSSLPVFVLTASALEADVSRTVTLGIEEYIVKPIEVQEFIRVMCEMASRLTRH
jgi:CheY-like chemotaxis protein